MIPGYWDEALAWS